MIIDFRELFPRYKIRPQGVLHVGANVGEEAPVYLELGIRNQLWIEPNPDLYDKLRNNLSNNPEARILTFAASDEVGIKTLHIANNAGQSSSLLELGTHKVAHPEVHYIKDVEVKMERLDSISLTGLDFLNIDVQGFELHVLKGLGEKISQFKWIYLEVNKAELYEHCALVEDIDIYLGAYGFERKETKWVGNTGWGDALFVLSE